MRSIVIPLLIGLRSSFRRRAELQVEIAALHQQLAVLQQRLSTRPRLRPLAAVFDTAERIHAALFFDEADALFGKRTEVSDAHDRYRARWRLLPP